MVIWILEGGRCFYKLLLVSIVLNEDYVIVLLFMVEMFLIEVRREIFVFK